ncbi:HAMP domain-containing histidine kinase [Spongiibacter sp. KMU-158]|uniref:histidine kinase n=1 Tax=Spongiibacter pelagi TaxID=2760804 RepID=A0A927GVQ3_9GAMM|nr:HAMP domain-containing sensor histidine kinase [Spongiibacter pelagi]MBD2858650.1 HAMP domain-containing histidine kinase [Spongiibacter pelagi]
MNSHSLRHRMIATTVVIIIVTSTLFASVLLLIKQRLEAATFGNFVESHLKVLIENPNNASALNNSPFSDWYFYQGEDILKLPENIQALSSGTYHSIALHNKHLHLQIVDTDKGRLFLAYDISEWEEQEHALLRTLAIGILVITLLALIIASKAANHFLEPIQRLSKRLSALPPGERGTRIAGEFQDSDIKQIATAFDSYLTRIDQFVDRERSFSTAASHELRTPLSVMMGATDILESYQHSEVEQRALARIRRACKDMLAFIEAALFLSREEDGLLLESYPLSLEPLIRQLAHDSGQEITKHNNHIELNLDSNVTSDIPESLVKIVVGNVLRNAVEHTQDGRITITLNGPQLSISDTGTGISPEHLGRIFERSFSTKSAGTGLGLDMVKRICDRFGISIDIDSTLHKGTTVTLLFPNSQ